MMEFDVNQMANKVKQVVIADLMRAADRTHELARALYERGAYSEAAENAAKYRRYKRELERVVSVDPIEIALNEKENVILLVNEVGEYMAQLEKKIAVAIYNIMMEEKDDGSLQTYLEELDIIRNEVLALNERKQWDLLKTLGGRVARLKERAQEMLA